MMKKKMAFALICAMAVMQFASCKKTEENLAEDSTYYDYDESSEDDGTVVNNVDPSLYGEYETIFTEEDNYTKPSSSVDISLESYMASCESEDVLLQFGVITIKKGGTYVLSGDYIGSVVVEAPETENVRLILKDANITSKQGAAISIESAKKVFVSMPEGTDNRLTDGGNAWNTPLVSEDEAGNLEHAVMTSKVPLVFNGSGHLEVKANLQHGIFSMQKMKIMEGNFVIDALADGIKSGDSISVMNGVFTINSEGNGFATQKQSKKKTDSPEGYIYITDGSFDIQAKGNALYADTVLRVVNGMFSLKVGEGVDYEGISSSSAYGLENEQSDVEAVSEEAATTATSGDEAVSEEAATTTASGDEAVSEEAATTASGDEAVSEEAATTATSGDKAGDDLASETDTEAKTAFSYEEALEASYGLKALEGMRFEGGTFVINGEEGGVYTQGCLIIYTGVFTVQCNDTAFCGEEAVYVFGAQLNVDHCNQGIVGEKVTGFAGNIFVTSQGTGIYCKESKKTGAGSKASFEVNGGVIGIHSDGDGIVSEGTALENGGYVTVDGSMNPKKHGIDIKEGYVLRGGTLICSSSEEEARYISEDSRVHSIAFEGGFGGGDSIDICDGTGNILFTFTPYKDFTHAFAASDVITDREWYVIRVGDETIDILKPTSTITVIGAEEETEEVSETK